MYKLDLETGITPTCLHILPTVLLGNETNNSNETEPMIVQFFCVCVILWVDRTDTGQLNTKINQHRIEKTVPMKFRPNTYQTFMNFVHKIPQELYRETSAPCGKECDDDL